MASIVPACGGTAPSDDGGLDGSSSGDVVDGSSSDDGSVDDSSGGDEGPLCGNGTLETGELCDDGNAVNTDSCLDSCMPASCGDGFVGPGEGCDDANDVDDDACTNTCALPSCGDGIVQDGEACDDANGDNDDACLDTCVAASCGDGFVGPSEACDDSNSANADGCDADCTVSLGAAEVATGYAQTCVRFYNGDVKCWGTNVIGSIGRAEAGDIGDDETPDTIDVIDLGGPAIQISAGYAHTCAVLQDGDVTCWGNNQNGQLGYGHLDNIGDDETPASAGFVDLGGVPAVKVVAGYVSTCALLEDNSVRCWGTNAFGTLGTGNADVIGDDELPSAIDPVDLGGALAVDLVGGIVHNCVLTDDSGVRCWGAGQFGHLGYGNTDTIGDDETPADLQDVDHGEGTIAKLYAGTVDTCVLYDDGALKCWGHNEYGGLGQGNVEPVGDDELPSSIDPIDFGGAAVLEVSSGILAHCARLDSGDVKCWGTTNPEGTCLGYAHTDNIGDDEVLADVPAVDIGADVVRMSSGNYGAAICAMTDTNGLRCWGWNQFGTLGYGNTAPIGDDEVPATAGDVAFYGGDAPI